MPLYTDGLGRKVEIPFAPQRIISLVPSQTELLYHLGLDEAVKGITKFCIHPQHWFQNKQRVGGTKDVKIEIVKSLQPDLIIANKEENVKEQMDELAKDFPVYVTDINHLEEALQMIQAIGAITGKTQKAFEIVENIQKGFQNLSLQKNKSAKAAYLIWQHPFITIGGDTFINNMMEHACFKNVFANSSRYPEVTIAQIKESGCQLLLLSSEPFPFQQKHMDALQPLLPGVQIMLVDGEMFSWYGSRLQHSPAYFQQLQEQIFKDVL